MSIELYSQGYRDGRPDGLAGSEVLGVFGQVLGPLQDGRHSLGHDVCNACGMSVTVDGGRAFAICIFRPCAEAGLGRSHIAQLRVGAPTCFTRPAATPRRWRAGTPPEPCRRHCRDARRAGSGAARP